MKKNYKLEILIPTYNREKDLEKNLHLLKHHIVRLNHLEKICIIVSNNNSNDKTEEMILELKKDKIFNGLLKYYRQSQNIGLEKNALDVLNKSTAEYVMYLGDDDYIEEKYLQKAMEKIENDSEVGLILPSFVAVLPDGTSLNSGRDLQKKSKEYEKGFYNCLINSHRGHQLSGIILKRENLFEEYKKNKVSNIYPFIFFTSISCLNYKCYHLTEYPVKVTQPGQHNKDWGYNDDGLVSEIFDNYKKLPKINFLERFLLEMTLLKQQNGRYFMYKAKAPLAVIKIITNKNTSNLTKIIFPMTLPILITIKILKKGLKKICQQ